MRKKAANETEIQFWRTQISPPRQILDNSKIITQSDIVKLTHITEIQVKQTPQTNKFRQIIPEVSINHEQYRQTLFDRYKNKILIYQRYNNELNNKWYKKAYFSSFFFKPNNLKKKHYSSVYESFEESKMTESQFESTSNLKFDSQFQSGNLFAVYQIKQNQYDLILQNDTNSKGNNQWYYFSISNTKKNMSIRLNIINFYKSHSLYNEGMKPLAYSTIANKSSKGPGWCRYGSSVQYYNSQIQIQNVQEQRNYYSLSFDYKFDFDNDKVFFANCFPYTVNNLAQMIKQISQKDQIVIIKNIGTSALKNNIYMIMIGEDIKQTQKKYRLNSRFNENKQSIIIMARQHPGETPGSFVCEGFIHTLIQSTPQSKFLLSRFNFFIFPMINIDGVINGNYRSNAYGFDLNRVWNRQKLEFHPQIFHIKNQIKKIAKRSNIHLILDFHGHSKKLNSFFFGNRDQKNPHRAQIFPLMASKASPHISFKNSTFSENQDKQNAARIVLKHQLKYHKDCQIYTFEASFYGTIKNGKKIHFTMQNYKEMGKTLVETIYKKQSQVYKQIKTFKQSPILRQIIKQLTKINNQTGNIKKIQQSDSEAEFYKQQEEEIVKEIMKQQNQIKQNERNFQKNDEIQYNRQSSQHTENILSMKERQSSRYEIQSQNYQQKQRKSLIENSQQFKEFQKDLKYSPQKAQKVLSQYFSQKPNIFLKNQKEPINQSEMKIYNELKMKEVFLNKISHKNSRNQQVSNILKANHNHDNDLLYLRPNQTRLENIYTPIPRLIKDRNVRVSNASVSEKKKNKKLQQKSFHWSQKQRRSTLDKDNVNQMIKIRKINYRIKAFTSSFRQEFIMQEQKKKN